MAKKTLKFVGIVVGGLAACLLAAVVVCTLLNFRTPSPTHSGIGTCDFFEPMRQLRIGMSVEEIVRIRPNVKRYALFQDDEDPLSTDYQNDDLIEIIGDPPIGTIECEDWGMLNLRIRDRRLQNIMYILYGQGPILFNELINIYGGAYEMYAGMGSAGVLCPSIVWQEGSLYVWVSFTMCPDPHQDSADCVISVCVGRHQQDSPRGISSALVRISEEETLALFRESGFAYVYRTDADTSTLPEGPQITSAPLEHYRNNTLECGMPLSHVKQAKTILSISLDFNRNEIDDLLLSHSESDDTSCRTWRLYLGTTRSYVADKEVIVGRQNLDGHHNAFWSLHRLQLVEATRTNGPIVAVLGFAESSTPNGIDVLMTAMYPGPMGGAFASRTIATGVSFDDWSAFEEWFAEQGTGWRIVGPLQVTSTPVSELGDQ